MNSLRNIIIFLLSILFINTSFSQDSNSQSSIESLPNYSLQGAAVKILSPASVQLAAGGRFDARFQGNIDYLN